VRRALSIALVGALFVVGLAWSESDAVATVPAVVAPSVSTTPALTPAFDPAIFDYVVRCTDSLGSVTLSAELPTGSTISVNGAAALSGSVSVPVSLAPNAEMTWVISGGGSTNTYYARCLPADFPQMTATVSGVPQAQWYMIAPSLTFANPPEPYVVIVDAHGTPVWWMYDSTAPPIDQKLMPDTGSGAELAWAHSSSSFASSYSFYGLDGQLHRTIGAGTLDIHDLQPTPTGTLLALRSIPRDCPNTPSDCVDESQWGGPSSVNPIDAQVVELDGSGDQVFSWSTRGHISLDESADWIAAGQTSDIIHINSVAPDGSDAFIFSARHLNAVYHVTKSTGAIDWKLGGTPTAQSLTVVGDPSGGPVFSGEHDARLLPDGTLTVHDNGTLAGRPPRVLRFKLDLVQRTATVIEDISDARVPSSSCCGSARKLTGGDWVVDWGSTTTTTELSPAGDPVLTIQLAPGYFSYRTVPVESGVLSAAQLRAGMDAMAVSATLAAPASGALWSGTTWFAAATRGPATSVEFHLSGNGLADRVVGVGVPSIYGWLCAWNSATVPDGVYSVFARASNGSDKTVDTPAVSVSIANLSVKMLDPSGTATISGVNWLDAGTTGAATRVEFHLVDRHSNDLIIGTGTSTPYGWLFPWDTSSVAKGTYQLRARAFDSPTHSVDTAPVTITVARTARHP
jgi:hypothetical protein